MLERGGAWVGGQHSVGPPTHRECSHRILSSKRPWELAWTLAIDGPKNGSGRLHRQSICMYMHIIYVNHRIIKKGGRVLTRRWALTRENTVLHAMAHACGLCIVLRC